MMAQTTLNYSSDHLSNPSIPEVLRDSSHFDMVLPTPRRSFRQAGALAFVAGSASCLGGA
jgi:hypothetical protein